MPSDYASVFQTDQAVDKYEDVRYAQGTQAWVVNERQRRFLRRLVRRTFGATRPVQHDFACGTGRVVDLLAGAVAEAHGYDVSPVMMARADELGRGATWHTVEPDGPVPEPVATVGPSIVTIFRLLLNVPPAVRDRAAAFAGLALPDAPSGVLVIQNHGSRRSLRHLRGRRQAGNAWFCGLSDHEIESLLERHGFRVVARRGFAMFPQGWYGPRWSRPLVRGVDGALCAVRIFDRYAVDVLYVAVRDIS